MKTTREKKASYDFRVDKIPYHVEVSPYLYNEQKRFIININGGEDHIYTWDEKVQQLIALDDEASVLPESLEKELSEKLVKTIIIK